MNDHSSSRWDDRSDSAWSRSPEHSSERSSGRSSGRRKQRKEKKKIKHRKKARKRKHGKKKSSKNKAHEHHLSEGERSSEIKSRRSHSTSRSLSYRHHSSTRRKRQSSQSFRDSRSYSRSYTSSPSRSRGRSYSRSRSLSRSRRRSYSRSRSRSYSVSRSRSRSRSRHRSRSSSRKRSLSRSPRSWRASKHKPQTIIHVPEKASDNTVNSGSRLPTVPAPESVPVIPLSDSPPPSRWKPGQKPWKPSYIHIQEIKAKVAVSISSSGQATDSVAEKTQTSVTAKCLSGDSESNKALKPAENAHSRSSRSKSYDRSRSRSRSRRSSYSRSRSRSPQRYHSRSSSNSRSDSEEKCSNKANLLSNEWKEYYSPLKRVKNVDKYISLTNNQDVPTESENRGGSEVSPDNSFSRRSGSSENIKDKGISVDQQIKHGTSVPVESLKASSDWDSDSDKVSQSNSVTLSKKQKQVVHSGEVLEKKLATLTGWNSESDSENIGARTSAISEKEEGEASSESEYETYRKISEAVEALDHKIAALPSSQSEGSPEKTTEPEKHKSKKKAKRKRKHKRRSESKSGSHHNKEKGKRSKRKHQTTKNKLKGTFLWQPPLEFGEEEEEDESKRDKQSPSKAFKDRSPVHSSNTKDQHPASSNKNPTREEDKGQQRTKHTEPHLHSTSRNGANLPGVMEQDSLDDMDICTPEHGAELVASPVPQGHRAPELNLKPTSKSSDVASKDKPLPRSEEQSSETSTATTAGTQQDEANTSQPSATVINFKWKPLKGMSALQNVNVPPITTKYSQHQESQKSGAKGVRMEIKSKSRVRPGSLFDEVRKTARLNQRPRNQESSSEERSPSAGKTRGTSRVQSPKKSRSVSRKSRSVSSHRSRSRGWSRSYSRSRSRSGSSSYSSR